MADPMRQQCAAAVCQSKAKGWYRRCYANAVDYRQVGRWEIPVCRRHLEAPEVLDYDSVRPTKAEAT